MHPLLPEVLSAEKRIRPHILQTPLIHSMPLSDRTGADVHLKMESEQHTNSFKARGAMNKVLSLSEEERARGVVTASTGNHAQGIARACMLAGCPGTIFVPRSVDPSKAEAIGHYPVDLVYHEGDALETELHARRQAGVLDRVWISPYNDAQIIGGQGTIGIELSRQLPSIDDVFVTVGGGGLIGGIAVYMKAHRPGARIIGCQPEHSAAMYHCVCAGRIVPAEHQETLSDGSAGDVEPGSITFPVCRDLVDDYILVSEEEIGEAIRFMVHAHHKIVEGAAAVAVASLVKRKDEFRGRTVVVVICGANIAAPTLTRVLAGLRVPAG